MDRGFIRLWRKTLDSRIFQNEGLLKVFIWCLLKATHKKRWLSVKVSKGTTEVELLPGQFIFGRDSAAKELRMKPSSVRNRMEKLKYLRKLDIEKDSQFSIITVINWNSYQDNEKKKDSQKDSQRTAKGQPEDTNKNVKNNNTASNDTESASETPKFYLTRRKRKLTGFNLSSFETFWEKFNLKSGKAEAADAWLDIPNPTAALYHRIYAAAECEAKRRPALQAKGRTPKMAQGWLAGRRWEDEHVNEKPEKQIIANNIEEFDFENQFQHG